MDASDFSVSDIEDILGHHPYGSDVSLIAVMEELQARYRYLPQDALILVSERLCVPLSQVYSVATFYNAFSLKPRGKHFISVCMGTACHVRGSKRVLDKVCQRLHIEPGETTEDRMFTLETVNCLGACALGPITVIDGDYAGHMTPSKVDALLEQYSNGDGEE
ncbi:MAG: NADH-quinone oxidoreductase subunit NuoE [Chloroflexi bacterium]|nr:MAG: NADH-quinone oxidoreductase subunit NuoE [Chloroflexota bacterium]